MKIDQSTPRDAASIIIYKKKIINIMFLWGRRSVKSRFMPSIYVFPGGSVDKEDYKVNNLFNLSANIKKSKIKTRSDIHTKAIMFAGIRETAEECNLYLAKKKIIHKKKNLLINNSWDKFLEKSLVPSFDKLNLFCQSNNTNFFKNKISCKIFYC